MNASLVVDRAAWTRIAVLAAIAVAVAAVLGWRAGEMEVPATAPLPATKWAAPTVTREDPARDLATLTSRRPWSNAFDTAPGAVPTAAGTASPGAPGSAPWRLAGIVERADGTFVLIAIGQPGATKLEYRRVGEALPDGGILTAINADNAVVATGGPSGPQRVYWLFRRQS